MEVINVLGEVRAVEHVYADGSYTCPFCSSAVVVGDPQYRQQAGCYNPWCSSNGRMSPAVALEERQKQERRESERRQYEERIRITTQYAQERAAQHRAWEQEQIDKARAGGYCLHCLFASGWERVKFVHHRSTCPKKRTA